MGWIEWIFILTAIFGISIYWFLVRNFNYWKDRGIDGPKPRPLLGNLPSMLTQSRNFAYDVDDIYREYKFKERFVGIFSMTSPQLLLIDPKLCQEILITNFKSFHDNEFGKFIDQNVDPILGRNPFFLGGDEWKEKRAEVTPALTTNRIKASYPIMQQVCAKMRTYLETESIKPIEGGLNAKELAAKFTTEVVANCIYGIEAGAFTEERCEIREMGSKIIDNSSSAMMYFFLVSIMPILLKIYRKPLVQPEISKFFTTLMGKSIELRRKTKSDRIDFLNYLLQLKEKKNLSDIEIAAHTMTFFIDGFETSSIVISNCLHLLAENQDAQEKLRNEINAVYAEHGELTFEQLLELPYLDQCFTETLRMRPPILLNNKLCTESCELRTKNDKVVKIEKDTCIVLPYYSIHHDPEYYPEPGKFIPERFSKENGGVKKYKEMGVFLPFGDGPRICLGMRFGICQSKAAIVEIIRNWEISLNPKTQKKFVFDPKEFLGVPQGGIWLDIREISQPSSIDN